MGDGVCNKCHAMMKAVVGLVFVVNWLLMNKAGKGLDWWLLIGILLLAGGVVKLMKPGCGHCEAMCEPESKPAKARRR